MLKIAVVSIFPDMFNAIAGFGITSRAIKQGLVELKTVTPRDFAHDRHSTVDDRPFGGGPGMVMMIEPLQACLAAVRAADPAPAPLIYLSPQGAPLTVQRRPQPSPRRRPRPLRPSLPPRPSSRRRRPLRSLRRPPPLPMIGLWTNSNPSRAGCWWPCRASASCRRPGFASG